MDLRAPPVDAAQPARTTPFAVMQILTLIGVLTLVAFGVFSHTSRTAPSATVQNA